MDVQQTGGIQGPQPVQPNRAARATAKAQSAPPPKRADKAEISDKARFLEKISRLPDIRAEKVEAARRGIAEGAYDTDERLRAAVQRLLDESF